MEEIKNYYPDGDRCCRALHTAHAVFHNPEGKQIACAEKPDGTALYEFEITGFDLIGPGAVHT